MIDGKRRWFGWVAIGLGALALAIALLGRGFGPQLGAAAEPGGNMQQQNAQPHAGPGANAQPGAGWQNAQPQASPGAGRPKAQPQAGPAGPSGEARRGGGRQDGGFGMGGGLRFPFRLISGSFQWAMLALLIGLGVWLLRGRNPSAAASTVSAEPAQSVPPAPLSPTGEAYIEEPSDQE